MENDLLWNMIRINYYNNKYIISLKKTYLIFIYPPKNSFTKKTIYIKFHKTI